MEKPYIQVTLRPTGPTPRPLERYFLLNKSIKSMKVGRASANPSRPTAVQFNNGFIDSPIVSREHARFIFGDKDQLLKIVDDGSTHGTFLNHKKLGKGQETVVNKGDLITFGAEVVHGKSVYKPNQFHVDINRFRKTIPEPVTMPTASRPVGFYVPTPSEDSEDEALGPENQNESREQTTPCDITASSGRPDFIDLTEESRPDGLNNKHTVIRDVEHTDHSGLEEFEAPEELSIVKETNLDSVVRAYGYFPLESDLEEEDEITSQSSPAVEDHDSVDVTTNLAERPSAPAHAGSDKSCHETDSMEDESSEYQSEKPTWPAGKPSPFDQPDWLHRDLLSMPYDHLLGLFDATDDFSDWQIIHRYESMVTHHNLKPSLGQEIIKMIQFYRSSDVLFDWLKREDERVDVESLGNSESEVSHPSVDDRMPTSAQEHPSSDMVSNITQVIQETGSELFESANEPITSPHDIVSPAPMADPSMGLDIYGQELDFPSTVPKASEIMQISNLIDSDTHGNDWSVPQSPHYESGSPPEQPSPNDPFGLSLSVESQRIEFHNNKLASTESSRKRKYNGVENEANSESESVHTGGELDETSSEGQEMLDVVMEHKEPNNKKARLHSAPSLTASRMKTFSTFAAGCIAGAVTVVAALVATTPMQLQEEIYNTM